MIQFIIDHWNLWAALALLAAVMVHCQRSGIDTNIGDFPKRR